MPIIYQTTLEAITEAALDGGYFEGWPNPPDTATHLRILRGSDHFVLAIDTATAKVIGFITAVSDGVSAAFIPHLGVLPPYQKQGIGSELVRRLLAQLNGIYVIDLTCDEDVVPFYARLGFRKWTAMVLRNYANQSGLPE